MARKTKFKPEWKFKPNTVVAIPVIFFHGIKCPEHIVRIVAYQIYNRSNIRYLCKNLKLGIIQEWDKEHLERYAEIVDNKVATVLYSKD